MSYDLESEARITFESLDAENKALYYPAFREAMKNPKSLVLMGTLTDVEGWVLREWARDNRYVIDYSYPHSFVVRKP